MPESRRHADFESLLDPNGPEIPAMRKRLAAAKAKLGMAASKPVEQPRDL